MEMKFCLIFGALLIVFIDAIEIGEYNCTQSA